MGRCTWLDNQSRLNISLEDFEKRNKNIYEGIEASGVRIEIKGTELKRRRYRYGRIPNHNGQSGRRNKLF